MKEGERGPFFPKLRVRIKDNNSTPHGKFYRFLFPFSSKFSDLNFASYVLYIYLHTLSLGHLWCGTNFSKFFCCTAKKCIRIRSTRVARLSCCSVAIATNRPRSSLSKLPEMTSKLSGQKAVFYNKVLPEND